MRSARSDIQFNDYQNQELEDAYHTRKIEKQNQKIRQQEDASRKRVNTEPDRDIETEQIVTILDDPKVLNTAREEVKDLRCQFW